MPRLRSNNPVLSRMDSEYATFHDAPQQAAPATLTPDQLQDMYDAPPALPTGTAVATRPMAIPDVVVRTAAMFVVVVGFALVAWRVSVPSVALWGALIGALVVGIAASVRARVSVPLYLLYAALEGFVIGEISQWYAAWASANGAQQNIVVQAVIGTFAAFAAVLVLYGTRIVRASSRFVQMMSVAMLGYLGIAVVSLIASFFGVGGGWGFYGTGGLGLLLCVVGVAIASFTLVLDFGMIERAIDNGAPVEESWRAAFGLTVTLIWLYLEILRFLAILSSNR